VHLAGRERDYSANRVNVFAAAKHRARRTILDDAEDILIVRMRRESLPSVSCAEQLEWLEYAHARHRR
jgi:hypothetical protein